MATVTENLAVARFTFSVSGSTGAVQAATATENLRAENDSTNARAMIQRYPKLYTKELTKAAGRYRNHFATQCTRIGDFWCIPLPLLPAFRAEEKARKTEYETQIANLISHAESGELVRQLERENGKLFDQVPKVPTAEQIRADFGIFSNYETNLDNPNVQEALKMLAKDVRENIENEVKANIQKESERVAKESVAKPLGELKELINALAENATKTGDDLKNIGWKGIADKIVRVVEVLPAYNFTNDPNVAKLLEMAKKSFDGMTKDHLKDREDVRKEAGKAAVAMKEAMSEMFG